MANLHPHWQATEDDAPQAEPLRTPIDLPREATVSVSRKPAAIVGILVALGIGFSAFQGFGVLLGQTTDDTIKVRITKTGLVPAEITVKPSQKITWTNEDDIPHILASTILTDAEKPLQTSPIFKGASATVTLSATAQSGSFVYASKTSPAITGTMKFEAPVLAPVASSQASSFAQASSVAQIPGTGGGLFGMQPPSSAPALPFNPTAPIPQAPAPASTLSGVIPQNPFTVDSPLAAQTSQTQSAGWTAMQAQTSSKAAPLMATVKPKAQAESGPGVWLIVGGSVGLLYVLTRKSIALAAK